MNLAISCRRPVIAQRATGSSLKSNCFKTLVASLCFFSLSACADSNRAPADLNMVVSISTDGNYAIATNTNKQAVLWNLKDHSYKIVFKDANIYSAYFIKNTDDFMYQNDKSNEVIVEDTSGKIIKTFNPGFPAYGEVMTSDLSSWFASDRWFQLYKIDVKTGKKQQFFYYYCGPNYKDETPPPKGMPYACQEFLGSNQLFGLSLTPDNKRLISTASGAMYIWDVATTEQLKLLIKNDAQTVTAVNPDGSYIITGDIGSLGYHYNLKDGSGYRFFFFSPNSTPEINSFYRDNDPGSAQIYPKAKFVANQILALKFIGQNEVVTILASVPNLFNYAPLYNMANMSSKPEFGGKHVIKPIKYLPLIPNAATDTTYKKDWPLTTDQFSRDQAIDTSPSAHILVMSMAAKNGIIVYKYDPKTQTLKREWAGVVKPSWKFW